VSFEGIENSVRENFFEDVEVPLALDLFRISADNSFCDIGRTGAVHCFSAEEQEQREKAGQNPEHRTENSKPEGKIPVCVSDRRDFARERFWNRCHEIYSSMVRTTRNRTLPLCICS